MSVTLIRGEESSRVCLEGVVDIEDAAELKAFLIEALERGNAVEVVLDGVTGLDVTAVQLLWSAQQEAQRAAIALRFAGQLPEAVSALLSGVGLREHLEFLQIG